MKTIRDILLLQVIPALKRTKAPDLILGQKDHPQRVTQTFPLPDYVSGFFTRHVLPEFCFCLSGKCVVHIDGCSYLLKARQACCIGRNQYHYESFVDPRQSYETVWFSFFSLRDLFIVHCRYRRQGYQPLQGLHVDTGEQLVPLVDRLLGPELPEKQARALAARIFENIGACVRRAAARDHYVFADTAGRNYQRKVIGIAEKYIMENHARDLSARELARVVNLSPKYFERLFHQINGSTFLQFLTTFRLEKACRLLNASLLNISEIAAQCGFNDYNNFSRVFAKRYGVSPRHFRDRYSS